MILSQTEEYALRAVLFIAAQHPETVRASRLARELDLPRNYLGKTLTALAAAGILRSTRGTAGGFKLARPPKEITLLDVTRAIGHPEPRRCLLGLGNCGEISECAVHQRWRPAAKMVTHFFDATTIGDLVVPTAAPAMATPLFPAP